MNTSQVFQVLNIFYDNADIRIRDKLFMGSPYAIISVYLFYVIFIVKILPKFMESRKAWNYNKLMSGIDAIICIFACYFFGNAVLAWFIFYDWTCQPMSLDNPWLSATEVSMCYQFLLSKFVYMLQSVALVLCKKGSSGFASYLLYHHTLFPIMLWIGANYYPGGHATFIGFVNSFVHINITISRFMGIKYPESGFKTHLRIIHMYLNVFQFSAMISHSSVLLFINDCSVPKILAVYEIISAIAIALIYKYFLMSGKKKRKSEQEKVESTQKV